MNGSLIILLHGVGSRGADIAGLGDYLRDMVPDARFAAPDAPHAFDFGGGGRQWFSVAGVTDANRPERVREARATFNRMIDGIVAEHGFSDRLDRVALVGFSQGSIMALDAVASGRWPVGAVVAFSGRFASPMPLPEAGGTPILLLHGTADTTMPPGLCAEAETNLAALGFHVEAASLAGVGHQISGDGARLAAEFLARTLAGKAQ